MTSYWPTAFLVSVAECFSWAHHIYQQVLSVHSNGPIDFSAAAPNSITWAHPIYQEVLLMPSHGPTEFSVAAAKFFA